LNSRRRVNSTRYVASSLQRLMPIPHEALDLENRSVGTNGEPTLSEAYKILKERWLDGDRDRELGLHLVFLAWCGLVEPAHLTGFLESDELRHELNQMLTEVHTYFEPQIYQDGDALRCWVSGAHVLVYV